MLETSLAGGPVPAVMGHRGAMGHAPENTLASIRTGAALGATWVEFDVKLTLDREVVVIHDDTLDRTTDGHGAVAVRTLAELAGVDAGGWYAPAFAGEPLPSLAQTVRLLAELHLGANVEIKPTPGRGRLSGEVVAAFLRDHWPRDARGLMISCFWPETLAAVRDTVPGIPTALLTFDIADGWRDQLAGLGCSAYHVSHTALTAERVAAVRDAGFALRAFTVNDPDRARTLYDWGVESIVTDYPERLTGL
ncbi:MAG: glycerophosphoryl diester phosphodiesterase [Hyphomicrobiales bacterium]|nr:glycerophosphoryl diester phosphodiesterase [Hyphomicrobiales bacterium]MCP5370748.1 glycerophosphoryl diester phosphodiesterase [Hyphomicrobiales bacterium]